jgi:hypothetical protein
MAVEMNLKRKNCKRYMGWNQKWVFLKNHKIKRENGKLMKKGKRKTARAK